MNIEYTAFDLATGRVMFAGAAANPAAAESDTVGVLLGIAHESGWVDAGVHYPLPAQPSPAHVFDWTAKQWVDPRTLQDLKDAKWAQAKRAREAAINAPLPTPFGIFDSDASARTSITDAVLMLQSLAALGQAAAVDFTLADNTTVTLNAAQMVNVGLLLGQKVQAAHAAARALRAQIEAATTPAEVEAIEW